MEGQQCAFVLHSRLWSEIGLMLDVSMEESGRVRLVVRGVCSKRSTLKDALQPFTPLLSRFGERGEVRTLRSAEAVSLALLLSGIALYSGLYINGLLSRILEYETRFSELLFDYLHCIQFLIGVTGTSRPAPRRFELALFRHPGYGANFTHCAGSDESVGDTMTYRHCEERGFITGAVTDSKASIGRQPRALNTWGSPGANTLRAAGCFTRMAFKPYPGGESLKNKGLFR